MLVRPEHARHGSTGVPGTVVSVSFQGASSSASVRLDGLDLLVQIHGLAEELSGFQSGDRMEVVFDFGLALCEAQSDDQRMNLVEGSGQLGSI